MYVGKVTPSRFNGLNGQTKNRGGPNGGAVNPLFSFVQSFKHEEKCIKLKIFLFSAEILTTKQFIWQKFIFKIHVCRLYFIPSTTV